MTRKQIAITCVLFVSLLALGGLAPISHGQGPTASPTASPTETLTPTASPTLTATPNLVIVLTLVPGGQAGEVDYTITAGQIAIISLLVFLAIILIVLSFAILRDDS